MSEYKQNPMDNGFIYTVGMSGIKIKKHTFYAHFILSNTGIKVFKNTVICGDSENFYRGFWEIILFFGGGGRGLFIWLFLSFSISKLKLNTNQLVSVINQLTCVRTRKKIQYLRNSDERSGSQVAHPFFVPNWLLQACN